MRHVVSVGDRECVNLDFPKSSTDIIAPLHKHAQGTSMPRAHKKYTVPQVDKGIFLPCYYVKMCRRVSRAYSPVLHIFTK